MNNKINDGGPAFPCSEWRIEDGVQIGTPVCGITVRDYFAAKALVGTLAGITNDEAADAYNNQAEKMGISQCKLIAAMAYAYADEMLAERNRVK